MIFRIATRNLILKRRNIFLFSLFVICFFCSSCSTTPKIQYHTVLPSQPDKHVAISIRAFNDERKDLEKAVIGVVRNGYGMDMGDVTAPPDMFIQIKAALSAELKNSGFTIISDNGDLTISAALTRVVCDVYESTSCQVTINFKLMDSNEKVMDHAYHGASSKIIFPVNCSKPLNKAIQNVMSQFVSDLNRYVAENRKNK